MALTQDKKGGPYTKDNQESRRNEVARLHFEYGYSARKIADVMKINRNTINTDIKYLYDVIKDETKQKRDDLILQQIGRLEAQRTRIIDDITDSKTDKIKLEKLLLDIDSKLNNILMKVNSEQNKPEKEDHDPLIREIVLFLLIKYAKNPCLAKEKILSEIVNTQQCTTREAEKIFSEMLLLGLEFCQKFSTISFGYDLLEFGLLRKYVRREGDLMKKIHSLWILQHHQVIENRELEEKYQSEFGEKTTWSDETFSKFDKERKNVRKKFAETWTNIISDILDSMDGVISEERFLNYLQCIKIFFGEDKTIMQKIQEEIY